MHPGEGRTAEMGTGWAAGGAPVGRRRLGEVLVAGQVLTEAQLDEALRVQRGDKGRRRRLGEVITALGLADEVQIARALSDQLGLPFLDLGSMPIPDETLAVLPPQRRGASSPHMDRGQQYAERIGACVIRRLREPEV